MQFYHTAQCHRCCQFWGSVQLACWLQECPNAVAHELNVNFSTISRLQRRFRNFGSTSKRLHNLRPRVATPAQDLRIQHLHLQDRPDQPPGQQLQQSVCITKAFLHRLETISGKLICMLVVLIRVSTWLQFVVVIDLSGQMLIFDGIWHFGEVFSSRMNPGFHCTGQMAASIMASCGWAVCWCQCCGSSGPW